jgi:hypothetical protein
LTVAWLRHGEQYPSLVGTLEPSYVSSSSLAAWWRIRFLV